MPFYNEEHYPYKTDDIREALMNGFYRRGFKVLADDSSWSKVFDFDYSFYNLSSDMADSIATYVGADLIVFGYVNTSVKYRPGGFYTDQFTPNPVLVKIYDPKKKTIVLFERTDLVERWGMFETDLELSDFGFKIATEISQLGY